ncbi:MAG: hypothetical protein AAFQ42_14135 [Pseudomonadota bacterium]
MINLEPATDAHFAWLIRAAPDPFDHLAPLNALIDEPEVLSMLHDTRNTVPQGMKKAVGLLSTTRLWSASAVLRRPRTTMAKSKSAMAYENRSTTNALQRQLSRA